MPSAQGNLGKDWRKKHILVFWPLQPSSRRQHHTSRFCTVCCQHVWDTQCTPKRRPPRWLWSFGECYSYFSLDRLKGFSCTITDWGPAAWEAALQREPCECRQEVDHEAKLWQGSQCILGCIRVKYCQQVEAGDPLMLHSLRHYGLHWEWVTSQEQITWGVARTITLQPFCCHSALWGGKGEEEGFCID